MFKKNEKETLEVVGIITTFPSSCSETTANDNNGQLVPGVLGFLEFLASLPPLSSLLGQAAVAIKWPLNASFPYYRSPGMHLGIGDQVPFLHTGVELWVF